MCLYITTRFSRCQIADACRPSTTRNSKKFRDTDDGRWTNRALHVRYLATSPIWAVHVSTEPDAVKDEEDGDDGAVGEEETGAAAQWGGDEMSPISPLYLTTNREVIRSRIVKALKRRKDWWMPHHDLHTAIVSLGVSPKQASPLISPNFCLRTPARRDRVYTLPRVRVCVA